MFKEENEEEKYIATTKLDMQPKSAYRHKKKEWKVEEKHEDLKSHFGLEECYSGKKRDLLRTFDNMLPAFLDFLVL